MRHRYKSKLKKAHRNGRFSMKFIKTKYDNQTEKDMNQVNIQIYTSILSLLSRVKDFRQKYGKFIPEEVKVAISRRA